MWEGTLKKECSQLARIAPRLLMLHATSCSTERLWSLLRWVCRDNRSRLGVEKARKMAIISMYRHFQEGGDYNFEDDILLESVIEEEDEEEEEINLVN
jgi:hypothetical protein